MLPAADSTGHHVTVHSSALPQQHSYSGSLDSDTGAGTYSAAAVIPLAATPAVPGQLLPAVALQGQQPQPQGAKVPAADGVAVTTLPQQQRPPAKEPALEPDASKEAAYEALWQWAFDVSGWVSCGICLQAADCHGSVFWVCADNLKRWLLILRRSPASGPGQFTATRARSVCEALLPLATCRCDVGCRQNQRACSHGLPHYGTHDASAARRAC